jgi:hypothetical protein
MSPGAMAVMLVVLSVVGGGITAALFFAWRQEKRSDSARDAGDSENC